jgi:hypothetical protein
VTLHSLLIIGQDILHMVDGHIIKKFIIGIETIIHIIGIIK